MLSPNVTTPLWQRGSLQWWPGVRTIDLNLQGRTQNKKHRALLPVLLTLDRWLWAEYATSRKSN
jgi:hypothetical protein